MSVSEKNGRLLVHCFRCSQKDVIAALQDRGLFPRQRSWDIGGARHVRNDGGDGGKRFWWDTKGISTSTLPLYNAEALELDEFEVGAVAIVCEGESDADALIARGHRAVGTVTGAGAIPCDDSLRPLLDKAEVILWPDNDEPGRQHMDRIGERLIALGHPNVRKIVWHEAPEKGGAANWVGTDDELDKLIDQAIPFVVPQRDNRFANALIDWRTFWATDHQEEDWLLAPLLPRGRAVAMFAPAKSGKSLLSLDVAARLATGRRVFDRPEGDPVRVLYLDMEMTENDLFERLADMGYGAESDLSRLFYYLLPSLPPLDTDEGGTALCELAEVHVADLVIIDTTSRVIVGAENDSDTLRAFYQHTGRPLKAAGRTVWRLDHAGKDLQRGQRGTSAKNDDVDLVWELTSRDDGIRLRATHRRQSWVPETLEVVRLGDPLRHERAAESWPSGTAEVADLLDSIGVVPTDPVRSARERLREHGSPRRTEVVSAAQRYRRMSGNTPGNTLCHELGNDVGKHSPDRFGKHPGKRSETSSTVTGKQGGSPAGEPLFPTRPEAVEVVSGDGLVREVAE